MNKASSSLRATGLSPPPPSNFSTLNSIGPNMKKLTFLFLMISCLIARADLSTHAHSLIGSWYTRDDKKGVLGVLNFKSDGRFDGYVDYKSKRAVSFEGKWRFEHDTIFYTYTKSEPINLFKDGKDQDALVEMADSYYLLKTEDGEVRRYDRIVEGKPMAHNQPDEQKCLNQPVGLMSPAVHPKQATNSGI